MVDALKSDASQAVCAAGGDIWLSGWVGQDHLLAHRHLGIIDIALLSGFNEIAHFNLTFRRRFGASPSEVRTGR